MRNKLDIVKLALLIEVLLFDSIEVFTVLVLAHTGQILFVIDFRLKRRTFGRLLAQVLTADRLITFGFDRMRGWRFHGRLLVGFGERRRIVRRVGLTVLVGLVGFLIFYFKREREREREREQEL